ncbi:H-type small acid-soluble spore protein [Alicyclobacillus tolerans]|uniref:H-type small acid-soluble spore protein n=1 Tax=Alicyclobacillus tolerans TaxID=90970 RepID=UPI001F226213|nr:H-type small acid-soluble spore protein [Alicyclobacillus tolerans]MCF8564104.1 H-type small acid-soluble spore protein [Alicyclobacillus tolerans]
MNVERAKQILQSEQKINVRYDGEPVWIETVDESTQQARVHFEQNPNQRMSVSIQALDENF